MLFDVIMCYYVLLGVIRWYHMFSGGIKCYWVVLYVIRLCYMSLGG